jgi:dTDP-4-dehydrorhamnose 3,5-epimerase
VNFQATILKGGYIISPTPFEDERGFFARWFCEKEFGSHGLNTMFTQCNQSGTKGTGSIRGMHFQNTPHAEVKLVKCIAGKIFDVIIDIRKGSSTFLQWTGVELSAENKKALYIPRGFAHGFQTLSEYAEIIYMVSDPYNKEAEGGIRYNDERININWPSPVNKVSEKDQNIPLISTSGFEGISL